MYIGVDCGTQSTKVTVVDPETLRVLGVGSGPHDMISSGNGRREQDPQWWLDAFEKAFPLAIREAGISPACIRAIGVSGQQHSMVAIDADGCPVYPAKLWCDTEVSENSRTLIHQLGGPDACMENTGVVPQAAFTVSKVSWLREHQPEAYKRIATILLPHDYLNYYLTGNRVAEASDASGTGYFDTQTRKWHKQTLAAAAPELDPDSVLPRLIEPMEPVGIVRPEIAARLGLGDNVLVSAGGGDNTMSAIGIGATGTGQMVMSLGTSGTVFGYSSTPMVVGEGLINNFCAAQGGWLPLICTLNVTSVTGHIMRLFNLDTETFNERVLEAPPGAQGITVLPFLNGERVPYLPGATGSFNGLTDNNFTESNLCRAVVEGVIFGLRYGLDLFKDNGQDAEEIRLVGGAAKSPVWRELLASTMGTTIVYPDVLESAAVGAALQAGWCYRNHHGESVSLASLCTTAMDSVPTARCVPDPASIDVQGAAYARYRALLAERFAV